MKVLNQNLNNLNETDSEFAGFFLFSSSELKA